MMSLQRTRRLNLLPNVKQARWPGSTANVENKNCTSSSSGDSVKAVVKVEALPPCSPQNAKASCEVKTLVKAEPSSPCSLKIAEKASFDEAKAVVKSQESSPCSSKNAKISFDEAETVVHSSRKQSSSHCQAPSLAEQSGSKLKKSEIVDLSSSDSDVELPGARVIVGPQGSIILDRTSLYIPCTKTAILTDEHGDEPTTKKRKNKIWSMKETKKFYRALATVHTDFTLMAELFKGSRDRKALKRKYKHEDKWNKELVDKALGCHGAYNLEAFNNCSESGSTDDELVIKCPGKKYTRISIPKPEKKKRKCKIRYVESFSSSTDLRLCVPCYLKHTCIKHL